MSRVLVLTTDLPYFPGRNGHDHFNLRYLARSHDVGVVAPCHDSFPTQSVANLEAYLSGAYFWPRRAAATPLIVSAELGGQLRAWLKYLPAPVLWWLLRRVLKIDLKPRDAIDKLAILVNCAPQFLNALENGPWNAIVLIQSSIEPWLDYLPASGAKVVYFHDVRSDYLQRAMTLDGLLDQSLREVNAIRKQEQRVSKHVDAVGFVSELDLKRAREAFDLRAEALVAPIPVDTEYYVPAPPNWKRDPRPVVLFTGHLSHPPNVDALMFFLREIWPTVLKQCPRAVFQAVGLAPSPAVVAAVRSNPSFELHSDVPDIRPYFWNASVYVVPMRYGGGVRQKIFEAWSMQVPVVCTTMAAEGTGGEHETHCWLEDTPEGFAQRVAQVIHSAGEAKCVEAAKQRVHSHNSIAAAAPKFQQLVERAIQIRKNRPFKLLYDLRWMELGKAGGMEQATYELISMLGVLDRRNCYRIYAPRSACLEWEFPEAFQVTRHYSDPVSRQFEVLRSFLANKVAQRLDTYSVLTKHTRSLAKYRKLDFDIVHSVSGYTHPDLIGFPGVLTINDLQHLHYPQFFSKDEYKQREELYRRSADRAAHVICISEFTRQDVHKKYGISLEKMTTVWIIPGRTAWEPLDRSTRTTLLAQMHLSAPFFFYPAHCWPHKNHLKLVQAFQHIAAELPSGIKLVMTGGPFPQDHPAAVFIRDRKLASRVVHLGYRSPFEMRALLHECLAMVFPSLFEGFGMPVAEAIIAGKPVLCSNVTSLPELTGEAALTFDPDNVQEIAASMLEVMKPEVRLSLSSAASRRRTIFSAKDTAIRTLSIYQRVHDELYG